MKIRKIILYGGLLTTLVAGIKIYKNNKYYEAFENEIECHIEGDTHDGNVVAHRGFSSLYIENSMEAVISAFNSNCVDEVEVDVRLTKDNEIVLMHNKYINLNCNGKGQVENKTLEQLKKYDYFNSQIIISDSDFPDKKLIDSRNKLNLHNLSHISTLHELFEKVDSDKTLIIDVKLNKNVNDMIRELGYLLYLYDGNLNIKIQSSNEKFLKKMKEKYPDYSYQIVVSKKSHLSYIESDYDSIVIKYTLLNDDIVEQCIENNKKVYVWTINTYDQYIAVKDKLAKNIENVTIVSDNPDVMCYLSNCSDKKLVKTKKVK